MSEQVDKLSVSGGQSSDSERDDLSVELDAYPDGIYDAAIAAHRSLGAEPNRDWIATVITNAVLAALAEFIGDGLLDANGQRWTKREAGWAVEVPEWRWRLEGRYALLPEVMNGVPHDGKQWGDLRLFVLERSETDQ